VLKTSGFDQTADEIFAKIRRAAAACPALENGASRIMSA